MNLFIVSYQGDTNDYMRSFMREKIGASYDNKSKIWFMPTVPMGYLRDLMCYCCKLKSPKNSILSCREQKIGQTKMFK